MSTLDVPVVLILFNRPERVAEVFDVIRVARPSTLLIVADGPRPGHPDDPARCRAARAVADAVDWPCDVAQQFSDDNLGCDARVTSGLDWAFSLVERAVVLEDDVVPDPSFFPWCAAMLDRYADVADVMHVAGRNELVRWRADEVDHLLVRRGSIQGWATWAAAWRSVDHDLTIAGDPVAVHRCLDALGLEPLLREHLELHLRAAAGDQLAAWDIRWSAGQVLAGGWSVVSPVNLVRNHGFGTGATRTTRADDLRAALPCGRAPHVVPARARPAPDPDYDRRQLLVEILATYRDPRTAARLARFRNLFVDADGEPSLEVLHHLAPFEMVEESIAVVRHLRDVGVTSPGLVELEEVLATVPDGVARRTGDTVMSIAPTVGVIVAVRNGVGQLGAALDAVLTQVPPPTDVVVLDGGSTDGSAELAAGCDGVRVVAQVGVGLGAARNQALRVVRGDLVAFCDSDDRWPLGSLAYRIGHLSAHPDCDAVVGQVVTAPTGDDAVPARHLPSLGVPRAGYTPGALVCRRHVFDHVGVFSERLRLGTDSDWFVRLRQSACRLDVLDETVLIKGIRAASLSNDVETYRRELMDVARAYLDRRRAGG